MVCHIPSPSLLSISPLPKAVKAPTGIGNTKSTAPERHRVALKEIIKLFENTKLKLEFTIKATLPKPETGTVLNYDFFVTLISFLEAERVLRNQEIVQLAITLHHS